ncbi:MAG: succinylglutamate desuccinylase/aspartoacylase family protein [Magnetococcales bacterium]|nr:succinylglutamate desuccinylase/aspartoacylase family protein [Magnetococcales bacterium]MBF0113542.1 succinylglutamate desuccinylase/aspartoacylase family protein [Magnetococcales bacterium]
MVCFALFVFGGSALAADPSLSFQDEVQELVKEAASQSTIVPESAKNQEGKQATFSARETCLKIGAKLSSIRVDECHGSQLQPTGKHSVEGYPILLRNVLPSASVSADKNSPKPVGKLPQARVLLIGGVHGDEYSSVSIVFKWMKLLEKNNAGIFHWHIVPLVNPDGLLRKQSTRTNTNGVDLNRNFPTRDWKEDSADYWVRRTGKDPRRFPGKFPLSEAETAWLHEEIKQFRPNVIVSIHAPFGLLDFDGPPTTPPERLGNIYLSLLGTYPGSLGRYAVESLKIPIITIELPHAGIMPNANEIETIWADLVGWMRGHVFDHTPADTARSEEAAATAQPATAPATPPAQPAPSAVSVPAVAAATAATAAAASAEGAKGTTTPATPPAASQTPQTDKKTATVEKRPTRNEKGKTAKNKSRNKTKAKAKTRTGKNKQSGKSAPTVETPNKGSEP